MSSNPIAGNEISDKELEQYNYFSGLRRALERLDKNPDFQLVITDGYFKDKAIQQVATLASDNVRLGGHRAAVMEDLIAISNLQHYFLLIRRMGAEPEFTEENLADIDDSDLDSQIYGE